MKTIRDLAAEMSSSFVRDKRNNGDEFVKLKDGHPEWMTTVCREAHGDMAPDDYRYEFIEAAVDAITNFTDLDDARDSIEADVYTYNLTKWLNSRADRTSWMNEVIREYDPFDDFDDVLMAAQRMEMCEVFDMVVTSLGKIADDMEDDDMEDDETDD